MLVVFAHLENKQILYVCIELFFQDNANISPRLRTSSGNSITCLTHAFFLSVNAEDPPMIVVRKFVHLLDQSDQDFQEELDLMKMREEVITLIRSNQQLENDLNLMDIKIGLLVKNKITLQVWSSTSRNLGALCPAWYPLPHPF